MKRKLIIIISTIIGLILISVGSFELKKNYCNNKNKQEEINDRKIVITENRYGKKVNETKALASKHCLNKLCVTDLKISESSNNLYIVKATVKNTFKETLFEQFVNINFITNDGKTVKSHFYQTLLVGEQFYELEIQSTDSNIFNSIDYVLEKPTDEEINGYSAHLNK